MLSQKLTRYFKDSEKVGEFCGSVLVEHHGKTIFEYAAGFSDFENERLATPDTIYRIGSITKPITATLVFQLQDEGRLSVTDYVCKYVHDCPQSWSNITIHHLLTHSSGIPSFTGLPVYESLMTQCLSPRQILAHVKTLPLEFVVGESCSYSNSGYLLLGLLLETVCDKKYPELVRERLAGPLSMRDTGVEPLSGMQARTAQGYEISGEGLLVKASYIDMSIPHAAGCLSSTVEDLRKFVSALLGGKLLSDASLQAMFTVAKEQYACGWFVSERPAFGHGGSINGFSAGLTCLTKESLIIIVLLNNMNGNAEKIVTDLVGLVLQKPAKTGTELF